MSWQIGDDEDESLATYTGYDDGLSDLLVGYDDDDDLDDDDDDDDDDLMGAMDMVGFGMPSFRSMARAALPPKLPFGLPDPGRALLARALAKKKKKRSRRKKQIVRRKIQRAARVVQQRTPTKAREWVLGFDSVTDVVAGSSQTVTSNPQVVFRADRVVVPSSIAASFLINDIKIGQKSQLISSDPVPAVTFQETAFGVRLKMDTAQISQDIAFLINNITVTDTRFSASMIGPIVE